jgi:hypothetical protein
MFAPVFYKHMYLDPVEYDLLSPAADELLMKVNACGVCGSGFHVFNGSVNSLHPTTLYYKLGLNRLEKILNANVNTEKIKYQIIIN